MVILGAVEEAALWVSGASLLVALAALTFSAYSTLRIDRATLTASIDLRTVIDSSPGGENREMVFVSVVNIGKRQIYLKSLYLYMGKRPWRWYNQLLPASWNRRVTPEEVLMPGADPFVVYLQQGQYEQQPVPGTLEVGHEAVVLYLLTEVQGHMRHDASRRRAFAVAYGTTDGAWSKGLKRSKILESEGKETE